MPAATGGQTVPGPAGNYRGRFAPSPTGPMHFGSLVAAAASYLRALQHDGDWLLRIEDIDPPREVSGAADAIIESLHRHGFRWHGDILYQSSRLAAYEAVVGKLLAAGEAYHCRCSRQQIREVAVDGINGTVYPGTCRLRPPAVDDRPTAVRLKTAECAVVLEDQLQGRLPVVLERQVGDFVIRRRDGLIAYALAVVVDDEHQQVTEVVRGADLLQFTPAQLWLQRVLGFRAPAYMHVPVAVNASGQKLSKQSAAPAIDDRHPAANLLAALDFLGRPAPRSLRRAAPGAIWDWAREHWTPERLAGLRQKRPGGSR